MPLLRNATAIALVVIPAWPASATDRAVPVTTTVSPTANSSMKPTVRPMTSDEKAEYDEWLSAAADAIRAKKWPEAEALARKILARMELAFGPEHPDVATYARAIGVVVSNQARLVEGEPFFRRALAIREKILGSEHPDTAKSLYDLAANLKNQDRYSEAEPFYRRALAIREKVLGPEHPDTAQSLDGLATDLRSLARYAEAESLYRRALAINEKVLGSNHHDTASSLNNVANILIDQGRAAEAEALSRRSLAIAEKILGPEHPDTATKLNNLAFILHAQAHDAEAESLFRRALAIREKFLGPEHPDTATSLNNFASIINDKARLAEAEPILHRSLAIAEKVFGPEHPATAIGLHNLASNFYAQNRHAEAEPMLRRALAIAEKHGGAEHPDTARGLSSLATNLVAQARFAEAEPLYRRALAISEKVFGPEHATTADDIVLLGYLFKKQSRHVEAAPFYRRASAIYETALGIEHPRTALALTGLGVILLATGQHDEALARARAALAIQTLVSKREGGNADESAQSRLGEAAGNAGLLLVRATYAVAHAHGAPASPVMTAEAFAAAQTMGNSGAGRALSRGAARASLDAPGQELARGWESALAARASLYKQISDATAAQGPEAALRRKTLNDERVRLDGEIAGAEAALRSGYPRYFDLIAPAPVSLDELRRGLDGRAALLRPDEALILVTPGDKRLPTGHQRGMVFAVTREGVAWAEVKMDPDDLASNIAKLRELLDKGGDTRALGRRLYDVLFADPGIASLIAGKGEWLINPQGVLLSLPFAALVTGDYAGDDDDPAALRATPWLGFGKALAIVPEVSALKTLRSFARPARSNPSPFFGIGDPDFAFGSVSVAAVVPVAPGKGGGVQRGGNSPVTQGGQPVGMRGFFRDAGADISAVNHLARLEGTRAEIQAIATSLNAAKDTYLLGAAATEAELNNRNSNGSLSRARVIAFATHGLIAGDLGGSLAQPALALTPPAPGGTIIASNDGLLTAGEAATLKLAADWVILSACNTAASNDGQSANGLSGLARAFFYAGADSLLVSHWRVGDTAAARLTTRAVQIAQNNPGITRAAALRQSMRDFANDTANDKSGNSNAYPSEWAPFEVIGVER